MDTPSKQIPPGRKTCYYCVILLCGVGLLLLRMLLASLEAASLPGDTTPVSNAPPQVQEIPVLEITKDVTLDPATTYGRIIILASGVTIDGNGASLVGPFTGNLKSYSGIGISAKDVSSVVLKNLTVRGFETGLQVVDVAGWTIENCNFSGNFDDPSFGWGQLSQRGGIVFSHVTRSRVQNCKSNRNWTGCFLDRSSDNRLESNDFSNCSDACLKMIEASGNVIQKNKLDYGNRAGQDEVHARDSACVLIENGSNGNTLADNSITHGGDGLFVRCLNGWVSTRNQFLRNDCSHAHNHGVECWCPGNRFEGNKANQCSYGFWMGGSDRTMLLNNEASFNGDLKGNHYSPHLPNRGHAGIVFMHGSGTHITVRGNRCVGNNGAGIALIGDVASRGVKFQQSHWVIESNTLTQNRWGVYAQYAAWIDLAGNVIEANLKDGIHKAEGLSTFNVREMGSSATMAPLVEVAGPPAVRVGQRVAFDASKSTDPQGRPLRFQWRFSDNSVADAAKVEHVFAKPGFYRVGVTVTNGFLSNLGSWDVFVVGEGKEIGTEASANQWKCAESQSLIKFADDPNVRLVGQSSLVASIGPPYDGGRVELRYSPQKHERLLSPTTSRLSFWIRAENPNIPSWQDQNPIIILYGSDNTMLRLLPKGEVLHTADHPESREGWLLLQVPLNGDATWEAQGKLPALLETIGLSFDSWGSGPFRIWLDGMTLE